MKGAGCEEGTGSEEPQKIRISFLEQIVKILYLVQCGIKVVTRFTRILCEVHLAITTLAHFKTITTQTEE